VGGADPSLTSPTAAARRTERRQSPPRDQRSGEPDPVRRWRAGGRSAAGGGEGAGAGAGAIFGRESRVFKGLRCRFRPTRRATPPEGPMGLGSGHSRGFDASILFQSLL